MTDLNSLIAAAWAEERKPDPRAHDWLADLVDIDIRVGERGETAMIAAGGAE